MNIGWLGRELNDAVAFLDGYARPLWAAALVFYAGGDVVTTLVGLGLSHPLIVEGGPVAGLGLQYFGTAAIVPVKLLVLIVFLGLWRLVPRPQAIGIPLGILVTGILVTIWNSVVILRILPT